MSDSQFRVQISDQTADQVYFALAMFPYPSGAGLHVGHAENFIYVDVMSRFQRMQGKTVINPIGRDAFGLPTENYAIKQGKPAHIVTQENIDNFIAQCKMLDISYDRSREINTSRPEYYKWTQRIFSKLFEKGLVYRKDALVNRCEGCQTVLANDQVKEGKCERCETEIIQKKHPQRFIKITDYADRLIQDLDLVDRPEETKTHQKNWIGKSEGVEVQFPIITSGTEKKGVGPDEILIYQCLGSEIQENELNTAELRKQYDVTDDGFVKNVRAFVKNKQGDILMLRESRYNRRAVPGGKVDIGMTLEQALIQEIEEELGVHIVSKNFLGARKTYMRGSKGINKWLAYYYEVEIDGIPYNKEGHKSEEYAFVHIEKNNMGLVLTYQDQKIQDQTQIYDQFPGLHTLMDVLPYMPSNHVEDIPFVIDQTIDPNQQYIIYYNQIKRQYGIKKISSVQSSTITIYTTKPETIYGVTALMLAPENESLDAFLSPETIDKLTLYREQTSAKTNLERQHTDKNKSGLFSGIYARHPLTDEQVPVWYADYVLADYATGAVMFVPAHDIRDYEFAQTINQQESDSILSIKQVIAPSFVKPLNPDLVYYRRDTVRAIIQHPNEDRYLFLTANDDRPRYVGGGVDDGLTLTESLIKEIIEETGYTDIQIIKPLISTHFAKHTKSKGINSYGFCHYYLCKLQSLATEPISDEEASKHQPVWMTPKQIKEHTNDIGFIWGQWQSGKSELYLDDGVMIHCSTSLDMKPVSQAKELIIQEIEKKGVGHRKINYKLRDRSVSRQRYRGSPIPIYYTFQDDEKVPMNYGTGDKAYKKDLPIVARKVITTVITNSDRNKYLMLKRNNSYGLAFVTGGIEQGEKLEQACIREVEEETGYTGYQNIRIIDNVETQSLFFAHHKNENRYMIQYLAEMIIDESVQSNQKLEQHDDFQLARMTAEEISDATDLLSNNRYLWESYLQNKACNRSGEYTNRYNVYNPHPDKSKWIPHLIPESELPVVLPLDVANYKPAGKSPLEDHPTFKYYQPHNPSVAFFKHENANISNRGSAEIQTDKPIQARHGVACIIHNPDIDKFLGVQFSITGNILPAVTGGRENDEDIVDTAMREIMEETGCNQVTYIRKLGHMHDYFYSPHKDLNSYMMFDVLYFHTHQTQLADIDPTEALIQKPVRLDRMQINQLCEENLDFKYCFDLLDHGRASAPAYISYWNEYNQSLQLDIEKSNLDTSIYLRECDTLDTFMCSTYYYLRFLDPNNSKHIIDPKIEQVAMPVDFYMGGKEHTVGHLLYSRFIYKFLYDHGYVSHPEPFARLVHQGIVLAPDGRKMSKRRGNVINPNDVIQTYGVDVTRTYVAFMGPVEQDKCRDDNALGGVKRFLDRVERLKTMITTHSHQTTNSLLHQTIKGATEDLLNLKYNTVVSKLMILTNHFYEVKMLTQSDYEILLLLLAPFATQLTSKIRGDLGHSGDIHHHSWPRWDESQIVSGSITLAVQVNGKLRGTLEVSAGITQDQAISLAQADNKIGKYLVGQIIKIIFVQDKILNFIVK